MDISELVNFLAPFLGPLMAKGGEAAAALVERFGEEAWRTASKLWDRLAHGIRSRPAAQEAAEDVAASPDNESARNALAWQLGKLLNGDPALRTDVEQLWRAGSTTITTVTASGERSVAVGGNVQGRIVTGDQTTNDRGVSDPRPPAQES
jgi:hypothetical protein